MFWRLGLKFVILFNQVCLNGIIGVIRDAFLYKKIKKLLWNKQAKGLKTIKLKKIEVKIVLH